jgi:hypothetical protein
MAILVCVQQVRQHHYRKTGNIKRRLALPTSEHALENGKAKQRLAGGQQCIGLCVC